MLTVADLRKEFVVHHLGGKRIVGFPPVSFHVREGGALAISGPSGAGKSSILKCLFRTYLPTAGRIEYDSELLGPLDLAVASQHDVLALRHREIGYVTQFLRVLPRVPAVDVTAEPLLMAGVPRDDARERAAALLRRLRIPEELLDAYPVTFSGGEQQRVNIARAVIARPRLLLLDEPTASLDAGSVDIVIGLLRELRDDGVTMVMIFHDTRVTDALADDVHPMPTEVPTHAGV